MSAHKGTAKPSVTNATYLIAAVIVLLGMVLFLWNPFAADPLKTEYHSGRDAFTVVPEQLPEPPRNEGNTDTSQKTSAVNTPQTAAIQAQLAEAERLKGDAQAREQRMEEINNLIARIDAEQGLQRQSSPDDLHAQTAPLASELEKLKARTERLQKRLEQQ